MSNSENKNNSALPDATIQMVITQTNYTKEEAIMQLANNDNDPIKVIREFMGLSSNPTNTVITTTTKTKSQERFRVIREEIYKDNHTKQLQTRN